MAIDREQLSQPALAVAPLLLGAEIVSEAHGEPVLVRLTEVEAYEGSLDPASHAFRGQTARNAVMFGPAGHLYCYFVYGMHWCANVTCQREGAAAGVLMRAAQILLGQDAVAARRTARLKPHLLASGPARLAAALGLDGARNGLDLLDPASPVRLRALGSGVGFQTGPRVGVAAAQDLAWRFWLPDEPSVSVYRAGGARSRRRARHT